MCCAYLVCLVLLVLMGAVLVFLILRPFLILLLETDVTHRHTHGAQDHRNRPYVRVVGMLLVLRDCDAGG